MCFQHFPLFGFKIIMLLVYYGRGRGPVGLAEEEVRRSKRGGKEEVRRR